MSMKGLVLGPGVVRTPSLIAHVIVTVRPRSLVNHRLSAPSPPLRGDEHCWLVWHIVQLSRSPQLRDLIVSESGRSVIIPRRPSVDKVAQSESWTPPCGRTNPSSCLVQDRTSSPQSQVNRGSGRLGRKTPIGARIIPISTLTQNECFRTLGPADRPG